MINSRGVHAISGLTLMVASLVAPQGVGLQLGGDVTGATSSVACQTSWITPKLGGDIPSSTGKWYRLELINHSKLSCSLSGTPIARTGFISSGLRWVNVGPPRAGNAYVAGRGETAVIGPGKIASVYFGISAVSKELGSFCVPRYFHNIQLTFSTLTRRARFDFTVPRQIVCTNPSNISVTGIASGTKYYPNE